MPDPIRKRFGHGHFGRYSQRAARIGQDRECHIRLPGSISVPFFQRRPGTYWAKPRPGSHLDGLVRVWPNTSGLEASWFAGIIGPGFWQDATGPLTVSHFQTRFRSSTEVPDNIVQIQPGSDLVLADCVRFWPKGSGLEASRLCKNHPPTSGKCFPADPDRMRIGSGMFTGFLCAVRHVQNSHVYRHTTYLPSLARSCNNNNNNNNNGNL